jgi:hypothetical protein
VDKLFSLLRLDLFLRDNTFPKSLYEAKTIVKRLRLSYSSIHACYNGCVLFSGELEKANACRKCKRSRHVERSNIIPCKMFHHLPLIPRLKQMFRCPTLVDLMTWYNANKSNVNGLIYTHFVIQRLGNTLTWPNSILQQIPTTLGWV